MNNSITVLIASPFEEDHALLRSILSDSDWNVVSAASAVEAWIALHTTEVDVVITECEFPGGVSWTDLRAEIEDMGGAPPIIVTWAFADERLWAEVLSLGGYDLLMKPLDPGEVRRVVRMAASQARGVWQSKTTRARQRAIIPAC